ncbi:hypothetical protein C3747_138g4 [Trypanosoma cruzi]|uniref:MSP domain-containing protein n=1 Tax=Trypanosoma cruzi TaxID=5693 RepID=A0A2V2WA12_TRYCR|nr:hypothetical protein C3747_138g4 [Trypanosoma cruzi]
MRTVSYGSWLKVTSMPSALKILTLEARTKLTLGQCYVSQPVEHVMLLRNNSPHAIRFEWSCSSSILQCTPQLGHMSPGSTKQLTLRLYTDTVSGETISTVFRVKSIQRWKGMIGTIRRQNRGGPYYPQRRIRMPWKTPPLQRAILEKMFVKFLKLFQSLRTTSLVIFRCKRRFT